mgnify:FL=1
MKIELSKRLQAVADLVSPGMRLADIGTDHAYIPIYLMENEKIPQAIAMDINKGPLERAEEHIKAHGLEHQIQTRLSDGMAKLQAGEADCAVIAGMGGALMIKILEEGRETAFQLQELVLQPQSELKKFRIYLLENGYRVLTEDIVCEDGKYYPMMKVKPGEMTGESWKPEELEYGKYLLDTAHPVLKQFLEREIQICHGVLESLAKQDTKRAKERRREMEEQIQHVQHILETYFA